MIKKTLILIMLALVLAVFSYVQIGKIIVHNQMEKENLILLAFLKDLEMKNQFQVRIRKSRTLFISCYGG